MVHTGTFQQALENQQPTTFQQALANAIIKHSNIAEQTKLK